jgi:hypothetical protein
MAKLDAAKGGLKKKGERPMAKVGCGAFWGPFSRGFMLFFGGFG